MVVTTNLSNGSSIQKNFSFYMFCSLLDLSFPVKTTSALVFSIILLTSLVGNTLIIIIVYNRPELRKTVNYFIVNMAVSDFVLPLASIPVRITEIATDSLQWHIDGTVGVILCKLHVFMERVSVIVSVQSLVWIAFDRFVAVVFPMKVYLISSRFRAFAIASTWIVGIASKSLDLYMAELIETGTGVICKQYINTPTFSFSDYLTVHTAIFQIAPLILMTFLYGIIALTLRRQKRMFRCKEVHRRFRRKEGAIRMTSCIMAAFYICVLPKVLWIFLLLFEYEDSCSFYRGFMFSTYLMFYLSSTINPIICMTFVDSYRRGLREILKSCLNQSDQCTATRNTETCQQEEITLQRIRTITL